MAQKVKGQNTFSDLYIDLIRRDRGEGGGALCALIELQLETLRDAADDRGSTAVHRHIHDSILPVAACFQVLEDSGVPRGEALSRAAGWMHTITRRRAVAMRNMTRIPFFFALFRRICPGVMAKNYPPEGWDMRFRRLDRREIAFDCHRCLYLDVTAGLGCPELCLAFCENDDIAYGAMKPKVHFVRTKTLAGSGDCCDFRMLNGRYLK